MASARVGEKRVAAWRASGLSADAFAAGRGFAGATLRWWSSRLKSGRAAQSTGEVRIARVVRASRPVSQGVIVELRSARVLVPPGVDEATLATVIAALGGAS